MSTNQPPFLNEALAKVQSKGWVLAGVGAAAVVSILYFCPPEQSAFYPQCLFHQATGLDCPGCGGLRATHQLLHGNFATAWQLNPFAVLLLPLLAYEGAIRILRRNTWPSLGQKPWIGLGIVAVFIGFGIVRNLPALAGR